jgi:hypothetical protein
MLSCEEHSLNNFLSDIYQLRDPFKKSSIVPKFKSGIFQIFLQQKALKTTKYRSVRNNTKSFNFNPAFYFMHKLIDRLRPFCPK